jgi:GNAT superfamily N-acetyltransferase
MPVRGSKGFTEAKPSARRAVSADLASLLELYLYLNPSMPKLSNAKAQEVWTSTLSRQGTFIFVSDVDSRIVATCMLVTAPNLMRGGRQHAFIENVVTHPEFRRQGHGRAVVKAALDMAWAEDCHHVLLQSGRKDPGVRRFYETCGLEPGLRTAYAARRPSGH